MSRSLLCAFSLAAVFTAVATHAAPPPDSRVHEVVDAAVRPVMARYDLPGMAVGVVVDGKAHVFHYGVASRASRAPVTGATLFEIGSVSKTFTATLASWAAEQGRLSLTDTVSEHLPDLKGTKAGYLELDWLGTHTTGGMPLQVPDDVTNEAELMAWLRRWGPPYKPGAVRTYSNVSIGLLGLVTAKAMDGDFTTLMQGRLFPALGLKDTYLKAPEARMADYAQGYTKDDAPIRVAPGVLDAEAYGVKTTAADLLRFVEANMGLVNLAPDLQRAVTATHTGYAKAGATTREPVMTQDLIWEQYAYPVSLKALLDGNSSTMALNPVPVTRLSPPEPPRADVWINKTGSTNGFGAYVAFVPSRELGIVLLANKNYPNDARVTLAHELLTLLAAQTSSQRN